MAKIRVYELANSLGIEVEKAMGLLREVGASARNHMSVVERVPARRVRQLLKQNMNAALPPTQVQARPAPKVVSPPEGISPVPESAGTAPSVKSTPSPQTDPTPSTASKQSASPQPAGEPSQESAPKPADAKATPVEGNQKDAQPSQSVPRDKHIESPQGITKGDADQKSAPREAASPGRKPATKPAAEKATPAKSPAQASPSPARKGTESGAPAAADQGRKPKQRPAAQGTPSQPSRAQAPRSTEQPSARPAAQRDNARQPGARTPQRAGQAAGGPQRGQAGGGARRPGGRPGAGRPGPGGAAPQAGARRRRRQAAREASAEREARLAAEAQPTGPVLIPDSLTVQELAETLNVPATSIIMNLMQAGVMAAINQRIEYEVAASVAEKLGYEVTRPEKKAASHGDLQESAEDLEARPPVVTIMGHVDHGKTTLLDVIRRAKVAEKEAGGITQHIGAYQIEVDGDKISFLDTPGHEAFTSMRSRGAQVTDIAVLVVAADDGVMPQTIEAINHAKAAGVPIIVAINKMDRPGANPDRIKQQLSEHDLVPEDWGGDTITVEVSALQREGIDDLLEMILLVAEMRELKANPNRQAVGVVIDAELDKSRGPVATVLVQAGTLRVGDPVVAGSVHGRVRAMFDETGESVEEAGPSRPVGVLGLADVPRAGDLVEVAADDKTARQMSIERGEQEREIETQRGAGRIRLSEIHSKAQAGDVKDLNLLIKGDVQGSVEALRQSVEKISSDEVRINVIHAAVGGINESDVALAAASNAIIIGFNVRPETVARRAAEREEVEMRLYRVIYEAIEEIEAAMEGMLDPEYEEVVLGRAEVRALFRVPNIGVVAGCYVTEGKIVRHAEARLLRDHVVIHEGKLGSLRRFKDDVREVNEGYECGMSFERYSDLKEGDIIEAFQMEEVKRG